MECPMVICHASQCRQKGSLGMVSCGKDFFNMASKVVTLLVPGDDRVEIPFWELFTINLDKIPLWACILSYPG